MNAHATLCLIEKRHYQFTICAPKASWRSSAMLPLQV